MSLENLSTPSKEAIVVLVLIAIIALKLYGLFSSKTTWWLIIALALVSVITDVSPTNAQENPYGS